MTERRLARARAAIRSSSALLVLLIAAAVSAQATSGAAPALRGGAASEAGDDVHRQEAREHFERALSLADAQSFQEAMTEFRRAYELSPHFQVLYNLGQSYVRLGMAVEAVDAFSAYLRDGGAAVTAERRAEVEREIGREAALIATLELAVEPAGAAVLVDEVAVGSAPLAGPLRLSPGAHAVRVDHPGFRTALAPITLTAGERRSLQLKLEAEPTPEAQPVVPPPPAAAGSTPAAKPPAPPRESAMRTARKDTSPPRARTQRSWAWILGGVAVAAGGTAIGLFVWNDGRFDDWDREDQLLQAEDGVKMPPLADRQRANNALLHAVHTADIATLVTGIAAAALAGTSAVLFLTDEGPEPPARVGLQASSTGAALWARARF